MDTNATTRRVAEDLGYCVRQGSYRGTPDDRLGRWYVGRVGESFRPFGAGYATRRAAWASIVAPLSEEG